MLESTDPFNELINLGQTSVTPSTSFYWDNERNAVLELTKLTERYYLVQASKTYHLLKQDEQGQENWDSNIRNLNDYLSNKFNRFRISVEYVNEVSTEALEEKNEARQLVADAQGLTERSAQLEQERDQAETYVDLLDDSRRKRHQRKLDQATEEHQQVLDQLKDTKNRLEAIRNYVKRFQRNGVMTAYLFTISTDSQPIHRKHLHEAAENHLDDISKSYHQKVTQTLQGSKFKLVIDEVTRPRVLMRQEHSLMHDPHQFDQYFGESNLPPEALEGLEELRDDAVEQYMAYVLDDIRTSPGLSERSKATPAQAVNSILQEIPSGEIADVEELPQDGPLLGHRPGTEMFFGIDPADGEHYYIVGGTGSGKSYLKRILIENCLELGYDILAINPGDRQILSAAFRNDVDASFRLHERGAVKPEHAKGLPGQYYWPGHEHLLEQPNQITDLFTGANFLSLTELPPGEKEGFVSEVFENLAEERDRTKPLFVFLDEGHKFSDGLTADKIQDVIRESRKFGVHVVISTQSPMDFTRNQKHVRENLTGKFFLSGEYFDYASDFDLDSEIKDLQTGKAIYFNRDQSPIKFNVRTPLSRVDEIKRENLDRFNTLNQAYEPEIPQQFKGERRSSTITIEPSEDTDTDTTSLKRDEEKLVNFIEDWIKEKDEAPTYSKCYREGPFSTSKTRRILDQLVKKKVIQEDIEERYGNESQIYYPT